MFSSAGALSVGLQAAVTWSYSSAPGFSATDLITFLLISSARIRGLATLVLWFQPRRSIKMYIAHLRMKYTYSYIHFDNFWAIPSRFDASKQRAPCSNQIGSGEAWCGWIWSRDRCLQANGKGSSRRKHADFQCVGLWCRQAFLLLEIVIKCL